MTDTLERARIRRCPHGVVIGPRVSSGFPADQPLMSAKCDKCEENMMNGDLPNLEVDWLHELPFKGFKPAEFQMEDMGHLLDRKWSANWSEMGAFKTSTVCWLIERWSKKYGIKNPKVLIVTTRSGKGTYFKHAPKQLPEYNLFNLLTNEVRLIMEGTEFKLDGLPLDLEQPGIYVGHYNVFSRRRKKKPKKDNIVDPNQPTADDVLEQFIAQAEAGTLKADVVPKEPLLPKLQETHWDIIILDEAHRIKERTTGWTKEIKKLKGTIKHVMTGTGFINDPSEVWSLFNFINKKEFGSYWRFREKYCAEDNINGFRKIVGINPDNEDEFKALIRTVGPRRTKREVFKNLPEPLYTQYEVELNAIQRRMYDSIRDELYRLDQAGEPIFSPNVLAALQRLRQVCVATPKVVSDYYDERKDRRVQEIVLVEPSSKLDAVMDILDGLEWDDERKDQVVIFSNFKGPIELLKERFKPKYNELGTCTFPGVSYLEMKSQDNDQKRYEKWAVEFPKKNHQVFICTLQLGSESISLTSASTCIFLDRAWSPKDNEQGVSRVWRPGQEEVAHIIYLNAKDTVDNRILKTNERKVGWFKTIFG
jgi:SNF2 family DNA or RNA helicase